MKLTAFANREQLEDELLATIEHVLRNEVASSGEACLLLSGGSTPINLYAKLSKAELPWEKITVALVDERFVPTDNIHSNEKMIRETLCQNRAEHVRLIGMVYDANSESSNLERAQTAYRQHVPSPTVCLLGMGTDGHTASLFPGDAASEADLKKASDNILISTKAPANPQQRISLSKAKIRSAKHLLLMIAGEEKLSLLTQNNRPTLPIDHFMGKARVFYST